MTAPTVSDAELMDRFDALEHLSDERGDRWVIAQVAKETGEPEARVEAVWQRWIIGGVAV